MIYTGTMIEELMQAVAREERRMGGDEDVPTKAGAPVRWNETDSGGMAAGAA
ncbi:MAG: hypothetical protein JO041_12080 [Acidobacteria bacterium]|nr:hypothetical protein [Acidobacteriota bacterium]